MILLAFGLINPLRSLSFTELASGKPCEYCWSPVVGDDLDMIPEKKRGRGRPPQELPDVAAPNAFARWLKESGTTVATVAQFMKVNVATVYGWRRGNRPPGRKRAKRLAALSDGVVSADSWD